MFAFSYSGPAAAGGGGVRTPRSARPGAFIEGLQ